MIIKNNIFDGIESKDASTSLSMTEKNKEIFEELVKKENLKLERIVSYPNSIQENKWYDQGNDEWVILLKGSAIIEFENEEIINLLPGDYVLISAHSKHRVLEVDNNEQTVWLALHY